MLLSLAAPLTFVAVVLLAFGIVSHCSLLDAGFIITCSTSQLPVCCVAEVDLYTWFCQHQYNWYCCTCDQALVHPQTPNKGTGTA